MSDNPRPGMTYADAGVDYKAIDPTKVLAQELAAATAASLRHKGMSEVAASRGESAYVWEEESGYRAFVVECLGTKTLVADAMRKITGKTYYDQLAQDTVAMIVNDVAAVGAEPLVVNAYWAVGSSDWLADEERAADLARGWAAACDASGATWGGGETPVLGGVVEPSAIDLAGACVGLIRPKSRLVTGAKLEPGDAIVLVESSGIHANGLTLARKLSERLPDGYGTDIGDGTMYGEALLTPTHLYPKLVGEIFAAGVDVHYYSNITGHGWRKLMRAPGELRYLVGELPPLEPIFAFLEEQSDVDKEELYGTLNMGAGFAVYVPEADAPAVVAAAAGVGLAAWVVGTVEEGPRQVVIEPLGVTFEGESLAVRG